MGGDTMIDQHIAPLEVALDRIGRIILSFYWQNDQFKERYGKQALPEFESMLKGSYDRLGDLVLNLKEKTVDAFPNEMMNVDPGDSGSM